MQTAKPIILIVGPTAGGKTDLAAELAKRLPGRAPGTLGGECVCADSMQIYRGMNIGTAKPTPTQRAEVPHRLLDIVDPSSDGFSVDTWLNLARRAIQEIRGRGRHPIVVGGTSLYVQSLLEGLFDGPEPDPTLRAQLQMMESASLRRKLEAVDPVAARRIHPNDRRRTVRAIEVFDLTGRPISELQQQWLYQSPRRDVRIIILDYTAEAINPRINARVKAMIEAGLVEEVRSLLASGGLGRQASTALGYKQVIAHLAGRCSLDEAVEQIKIHTRRYAKQQRTWLRRFRLHPDSIRIRADDISPQQLVYQSFRAILDEPESARSSDIGGLAPAGLTPGAS